MLYNKEGLPQEGELVACTVTKINPTSVFVTLDHYNKEVAMLHISEVAPGRIRNLNEYVSVGKMLITQVLTLDNRRGHIDLSLRRVSEQRRAKKISEIKQEMKAEKLIEQAAEELKTEFPALYERISKKVLQEYEYMYVYFQELVQDLVEYKLMGATKKQEDVLRKLIVQRIKPPVMEIRGEIKLKSYSGDGLDVVKELLTTAQKTSEALELKNKGAGVYSFCIQGETFEFCEQVLKDTLKVFDAVEKDKTIEFSYEKFEGKEVLEA